MTDEQQKTLTNFETRVKQLILLCDKLRKENAELGSLLDDKEQSLNEAKEAVRSLTTKYDNLKLAKMLSHDENDVKSAQQRVSRLVREIDRCIVLIHE
jgi:DNA repair exonuclease SbcCD ATPase subunit